MSAGPSSCARASTASPENSSNESNEKARRRSAFAGYPIRLTVGFSPTINQDTVHSFGSPGGPPNVSRCRPASRFQRVLDVGFLGRLGRLGLLGLDDFRNVEILDAAFAPVLA